jgi:hypothetical protein
MATQAPANMVMQGTVVPAQSVNAQAFFQGTRRQNLLMRSISTIAGPGFTDLVPILQTGVLSHLRVKIYGNLVVTLPTGTCATTTQWPYNVARFRMTANGQSNLIAASGWSLKMMAVSTRNPLDDRGVVVGWTGASPGTQITQGSLSQASEAWGVGAGVTAIPAGTYDVELIVDIPVAFDPISLMGAIFAQTQSTDLELAIDWQPIATLFTLTGTATATFTPNVIVEGTVFTIPSDGQGGIFVPNLSSFHSITESRAPNSISNGLNEITLAGQGVGRQLMRLAFRVWNGASPGQLPLVMNATNFTTPYWKFGGSTVPEQFADGRLLAMFNEFLYNTYLGNPTGFGVFDFSSLWAQRDSIDMGASTQLRFGFTIPTGVTLTAPYCEYVQETIIAGATAA